VLDDEDDLLEAFLYVTLNPTRHGPCRGSILHKVSVHPDCKRLIYVFISIACDGRIGFVPKMSKTCHKVAPFSSQVNPIKDGEK
jgi:hypothetical protein